MSRRLSPVLAGFEIYKINKRKKRVQQELTLIHQLPPALIHQPSPALIRHPPAWDTVHADAGMKTSK
jgi:hypothetical protein